MDSNAVNDEIVDKEMKAIQNRIELIEVWKLTFQYKNDINFTIQEILSFENSENNRTNLELSENQSAGIQILKDKMISSMKYFETIMSTNMINECDQSTHHCHKLAKCFDRIGDYNCVCIEGYYGNGFNSNYIGGTGCTNIDECKIDNKCHADALCTDSIGDYTCTCQKNHFGNGEICIGGSLKPINVPIRHS